MNARDPSSPAVPSTQASANSAPGASLIDVGELPRGSYLGGSDVAAIMRLHPYRTPLDVWRAKCDPRADVAPDPAKEKLFRRGKLLEPVVLEMMRQDYGITVHAANHRYRMPGFDHFAAEIDFEWSSADDPTMRNGEVKTVHPLAGHLWGAADSEDVPVHYAAQAMWGLACTGRDLCQFGVLFGADDLTLYYVRRDEETVSNMIEAAATFWDVHVHPGVPPAPSSWEDFAYLWPKDLGTSVEATPEIATLIDTYAIAASRKGLCEKTQEMVGMEIAEFAKDHTTITYQGKDIATYKAQSRETVDSKRLKVLSPEIYAKCAKESSFRVLRPKKERD